MIADVFRNFFNWNGRICRRQFLVLFILAVVVGTLLTAMIGNGGQSVAFLLQLFLIPSYMKRLHDIGWSGGLIFLSLIPFVGAILFLLMLVVGGTKGPNKYGPDPRTQSYSSTESVSVDERTPVPPTDKWQELGDALGTFILMITEQDKSLKTLQEKLEMRYLVLLEADHLIFANFRAHRERITDRMLARVIVGGVRDEKISRHALQEYNERIPVYMACKELISKSGATVGTRSFALSHFLQKARGKASGKDMIDVITGKKELDAGDMDEFLNFFESMPLVMELTQTIIGIKRIIDKFKEF